MAEWKKVVVSGSDISQLNNDSNYLVSGDSGVELTGSFKGDGSQLTGVTADTLGSSLTDGNGIADFTFDGSGAASVAVQADGSTLSVGTGGVKVADAGITATQIASAVAGDGLSGGAGTALSVNTDGTSITTSGDNLTLVGTTFSSSVDSRIDTAQTLATSNSASIAALDTDFATDADLSSLSGSAHTARASVASTAASATSGLSGSAHTARASVASTAASATSGLSGSAHTARASVASTAATATSNLSGSVLVVTNALDGRIDTLEADTSVSTLSGSAHTARASVASTAASATSNLSGSVLVVTNALDGRIDTLEGDSHTHANKTNLDAINQDLGTSDDVTFNDVVVSGDLTVSGTTTTLNTTNLLVEDKFILLNSGSANPDEGGLIIDEGTGSGHAFIYDKGDTRWGFNASVAQDASTANATAHAAAVVDIQNVAHSDSAEYQKNGNIKVDSGDIFIYC